MKERRVIYNCGHQGEDDCYGQCDAQEMYETLQDIVNSAGVIGPTWARNVAEDTLNRIDRRAAQREETA